MVVKSRIKLLIYDFHNKDVSRSTKSLCEIAVNLKKYWLSDDEALVREFAKHYIQQLGLEEKHERLRSEESIELRKHKFGIRDKSK